MMSSSSSSSSASGADVSVLFKDCGDVWCPLERLYFSTSSNQLISRHPLLSLEEVISSYCPQCLTRYTDEEALTQNNRCRTCFHCPHCGGILVAKDLSVREGPATPLVCTNCAWECVQDIIDPTTAKHTHNRGLGEEVDSVFTKLFNAHKHSQQSSASNSASEDVPLGSWRWEDLARKIDQREKTTFHTNAFEGDTAPGAGVVYEAENPVLGVPLCTKKTLRSRQDFESGKMNILVQSKPSPLDGDSSMKLQKGKWWIKDSSAIHDLPFISVIKLPCATDTNPSILIRMTNPKDIDASVKFLFSSDAKDGNERLCLECDDLGAFRWREIPRKVEFSSKELPSFTINGYEDELLREEAETSSVPSTLRELGWSVQIVGNHAFVQIPLVNISSESGSRVHIPLHFQWTVSDKTQIIDVMVQFSI